MGRASTVYKHFVRSGTKRVSVVKKGLPRKSLAARSLKGIVK
jgi:hypothetical protein